MFVLVKMFSPKHLIFILFSIHTSTRENLQRYLTTTFIFLMSHFHLLQTSDYLTE